MKAINGTIWSFLEKISTQIIQLILQIVLARLLVPELYGTIALVTVFISILSIFINTGLGTALVQKKNADDLDFSSVFYFNLFMCIILYIFMYIISPWISNFYNNPNLKLLCRILSLSIPISGLYNIQISYVAKHLLFNCLFWSNLVATIISGIVGIYLAYNNYGIWALVVQQLSHNGLCTLILWFTVKWHPKLIFSWHRFRRLWEVGWKMLCSGLIYRFFLEFRQLIIGKMYTSADLAFYNRGHQLPNLIVSNINASIDSVLLSVMSDVQDNVDSMRRITRRAIMTSTYLLMPLLAGFSACSYSLVRIILTDKWLPCVPYIRIFCITFAFMPIHTVNLKAIVAMGHTDIFLKLDIIKNIISIIVLAIAMWFGVMAIAYSLIFTSIISQIINSWPNRKLLKYDYNNQLKDIMPSICLSIFMGVTVYGIQFLKMNSWITLLIQIPLGIIIYLLGSILFKVEAFNYILNLVKPYILKQKL